MTINNNAWIREDLKHIWHPYTQMKDCLTDPPILVDRAKGIKLFDADSKEYYDVISSWWCNIHGHSNRKINKAIKEQLDKLEHVIFAGFTHKGAISLAGSLVSIAPADLKKVFFSDDGSTAVETALKMSLQYWRQSGKKEKTLFVSLDRGYHGDTIGAMSVSGDSIFNDNFKPVLFKTFKALSPYCYRCPAGKDRQSCSIECANSMEDILKAHSKKIAAIIVEPIVMAAGGMIIYPPEYLKKIAALAKRYNVHLIVDEVATGFGRTGRMFASEWAGKIAIDFLCLSKGLTAGYLPMGATLTTDDIYNAFYDDYEKMKTFYHGHTYTANPLACAAALAGLKIFKEEDTMSRIRKLAPEFGRYMESFRNIPHIGDVRYIGMVGALELVKDARTKEPFSLNERIGQKIYRRALKEGLILRPLGQVVYFYLPLCVTKNELAVIMRKATAVLSDILA